jgi:hypothetical protein
MSMTNTLKQRAVQLATALVSNTSSSPIDTTRTPQVLDDGASRISVHIALRSGAVHLVRFDVQGEELVQSTTTVVDTGTVQPGTPEMSAMLKGAARYGRNN